MMRKSTVKWLKAAGIRAVKTFAETCLGLIGMSVYLCEVDWRLTLSSAALSAIVSLLFSIKGLPELDNQ